VARKVIVTGDAKPDSVLKKVRKVRKDAQFVPKKKLKKKRIHKRIIHKSSSTSQINLGAASST
jgi:DNA polymerase III delta subunit